MIGALILALALPAAAGWSLTGLCLPRQNSLLSFMGRGAFALLSGLGLSSLLPLFWLLVGGRLGKVYMGFDAILFCALAIGLGWRAPRPPGGARANSLAGAETGGSSHSRFTLDLAAQLIFLFAMLLAVAALYRSEIRMPHGDWDAWAVWNHRARFLLRAGAAWRDAFSDGLAWNNIGYPLLLPLGVARLWVYTGETTVVPAVFAIAFTLAAPAAIAAAAAAATRPLAGATAGLLLLGTPSFIYWGGAQYADVPVAALFAGGLAALLHAERMEGRERFGSLAVGGLFLGLAGWTKNEGLAAAALAVTARTAIAARARGIPAAFRELSFLAAGMALPAAAWLAFHLAVVPDVLPRVSPGTPRLSLLQKLSNPDRWVMLLTAITRMMPGATLGIPFLAVLLAALLGLKPRHLLRSPAFIAAVLLYLVHIAMFLTSPWPLAWHLDTSADRLFLQPWPALLLGLFSAVDGRAASIARRSPAPI
jgi:hypothetical protein